MGWWSLGEHGGIGGFMDAPRAECKELDLIMGDAPADVLGNFLEDLRHDGVDIPSREMLIEAVTSGNYDALPVDVRTDVHGLRIELFRCWQEAFTDDGEPARDPHPLEIKGCFDFVMYDGYDRLGD